MIDLNVYLLTVSWILFISCYISCISKGQISQNPDLVLNCACLTIKYNLWIVFKTVLIMKILLLTLCVGFTMQSNAQEWTPEHEAVLTKFQISKNDSRGLVLHEYGNSNCNSEFASLEGAIESFFTSLIMSDVTQSCVEDFGDEIEIEGEVLDIFHVVDLYTRLTIEK